MRPASSQEVSPRAVPARAPAPPVIEALAGQEVPPPGAQVAAEAFADLEVQRARREVELLAIVRQQDAAQAVWAIQAHYAQSATRRRIDSLKVYGQSLTRDVPPEWKAAVVRDLETYVTSEQFPPTVSESDARNFIEARVGWILAPYRRKIAKEKERIRRRDLRRDLMASGIHYARLETMLWDSADADEAREQIRDELERSVHWDWTQEHVRSLVDDILDEWDEQGDEVEDGEGDEEDGSED